jgi:hypothetical protein
MLIFALSASCFQEKYSMLISKDKIMLQLRWIVLLAFAWLSSCWWPTRRPLHYLQDQQADTPPFTPKDAGQFTTDVPVAWFDLAYELARSEGLTPPVAARTFGYLGVALYEAVVPGMPGYQSLAGQLNGLEAMPEPADLAYHWPTVANSALAAVLGELLPGAETAVQAQEDYFVAQFQPDCRRVSSNGRSPVGRPLARR